MSEVAAKETVDAGERGVTPESVAGVEEVVDGSSGAREVGPHGFPENTPIADMTLAEQAAYHKFQKRKAEAQRDRERREKESMFTAESVDAARAEGLQAGLRVAAEIELARLSGKAVEDVKPVIDLLKPDVLVADGGLNAAALAALAGVGSVAAQNGGEVVDAALLADQIKSRSRYRHDEKPGNPGGTVSDAKAAEDARIRAGHQK